MHNRLELEMETGHLRDHQNAVMIVMVTVM